MTLDQHPETPATDTSRASRILSKVPEVTIYFWIIKILCTTVGETASDYLNFNLGLGLVGTSAAMGVVLAVALAIQFKARRYVPSVYWAAVVLISVFGTLVTDILTDSLGVPLEASTAVISAALVVTFILWYRREGTLSIHSIYTLRRELFYWLAILFTFALGTAAGDLMAESLGLGYLITGIIVCAAIVAVVIAWRLGLDPVLAFWMAYIFTRPLGASLGDYLTQDTANGGLGLGASVITAVFLLAIIGIVAFLSFSRRDAIGLAAALAHTTKAKPAALWQVVAVVALLVVASSTGYAMRRSQLRSQAAASVTVGAPLGDLSVYRQITGDTLALVRTGDLAAAKTRIGDLEFVWDNAEGRLRAMNPERWTAVDDAIDTSLHTLRSRQPNPAACSQALEALATLLDSLASATS